MFKILALMLSLLLIFALPVSSQEIIEEPDITPLEAVSVAAEGETIDIKAQSAILMDKDSGTVLYESGADEKCAPASITKIMSLILIMEAIDKGNLTYDTILTCSDTAAQLGGSQIWLEPGETMSVHELLKAVTVVSANDATVLLAEAVAGSEESFVVMMNKKAKELGMNSTNFENSTGLDSENHYSTAHDVALMSAELLKHEKIKEYTTIWMDSLRNGESELVNTNKLVRFYEGCTGLKTGTTSDAGYCLSASAEREGLSLIAVVMNGETSNDRFSGAQKLLSYGFAHYKRTEIQPSLEENLYLPVKKGTEKQVKVTAEENFSTLLRKDQAGKVTSEVILPENLTAPVTKGQQIGEIRYLLEGEEIGVVPICAENDIKKLDIWCSFAILLKYLCAH
jgi:D-alanyl-D-alanine carboxypeptidase (penicillin-binding protein 5/6)